MNTCRYRQKYFEPSKDRESNDHLVACDVILIETVDERDGCVAHEEVRYPDHENHAHNYV